MNIQFRLAVAGLLTLGSSCWFAVAQEVINTINPNGDVPALATVRPKFADSGRLLMLVLNDRQGYAHRVLVHDVISGKPVYERLEDSHVIMDCELSGDGKRMKIVHQRRLGSEQTLQWLDLPTRKQLYVERSPVAITSQLSPDGEYLLVHRHREHADSSADVGIHCIRSDNGKDLFEAIVSSSSHVRGIFSPDSDRVLLWGERLAEIWSTRTGTKAADLPWMKDVDPLQIRWATTQAIRGLSKSGEWIEWDTRTRERRIIKKLRRPPFGQLDQSGAKLIGSSGGQLHTYDLTTESVTEPWLHGPRPVSTVIAFTDDRVAISVDGGRGGSIQILRRPRANDAPPATTQAATRLTDSTTRTVPAIRWPESNQNDRQNPLWWTQRAIDEAGQCTDPYSRSATLYTCSAFHARSGDISAAESLLKQAGSLLPEGNENRTFSQNERSTAYYYLSRRIAKEKGIEPAKLLQEELNSLDLLHADWRLAAALAEGRAMAGDFAGAREILKGLKGEQRAKVSSRVARICFADGKFEDTDTILHAMDDSNSKAYELLLCGSALAKMGKFDQAQIYLESIRRIENGQGEFTNPMVRAIAVAAHKANRTDVIENLRKLPSRLSEVPDAAIVLQMCSEGKLEAAKQWASQVPQNALAQLELRHWATGPSIPKLGADELIDLVLSGKSIGWPQAASNLIAQDRMNDAVKILDDARFKAEPLKSRMQFAPAVLSAMYLRGQVKEADKRFDSEYLDGREVAPHLETSRAVAHHRNGNDLYLNELKARLNMQATGPKSEKQLYAIISLFELSVELHCYSDALEQLEAMRRWDQEGRTPESQWTSLLKSVVKHGSDEDLRLVFSKYRIVGGRDESYGGSFGVYLVDERMVSDDRIKTIVEAIPLPETRANFLTKIAARFMPRDVAEGPYEVMQ